MFRAQSDSQIWERVDLSFNELKNSQWIPKRTDVTYM